MCLLTATENYTTFKADTSTVKENWYYFIIVGAGIFIICILAFVAYYNCRKEKRSEKVVINLQQNSLYSRIPDDLGQSLSYDPELEFPREK